MEARGWYSDRTGARYVHVPLGKGKRKSVRLTTCSTDDDADARAPIVREIATILHEARHHTEAVEWAVKAADGDDARAKKILGYARALSRGEEKKAGASQSGDIVTFKDIGGLWTTGELAKTFPDQVPSKRTVDLDASRLEWLYTSGELGEIPIVAFRVEHAEKAMQKLDRKLRPATRRQYAQAIRRVCELAVYPLRLISANPLPRGFLPKARLDRSLQMLYPDEEKQYLEYTSIPLVERVTCGFLSRMGFRKSEAIGSDPDDQEPAPALTWDRIDLERGVVYMARSKTEGPRPIAMPPDVVRALKKWRAMNPVHQHVFADTADHPIVLEARYYREHLKLAGVTRTELHAMARKDSIAVRVHDLRALYVTVSIAQGKPEHWIRDRTAHKTLSMLDRYRRQARMFEELHLGSLIPLDEAIPEFRDPVGPPVGGASDGGHDRKASESNGRSTSRQIDDDPIREHAEGQTLGSAVERREGSSPSPCTFRGLDDAAEQMSDGRPTLVRQIDPVESALADGIRAIADALGRARPDEIAVLSERMASLARELEARRMSRASNVVPFPKRSKST